VAASLDSAQRARDRKVSGSADVKLFDILTTVDDVREELSLNVRGVLVSYFQRRPSIVGCPSPCPFPDAGSAIIPISMAA